MLQSTKRQFVPPAPKSAFWWGLIPDGFESPGAEAESGMKRNSNAWDRKSSGHRSPMSATRTESRSAWKIPHYLRESMIQLLSLHWCSWPCKISPQNLSPHNFTNPGAVSSFKLLTYTIALRALPVFLAHLGRPQFWGCSLQGGSFLRSTAWQEEGMYWQ